MSSTPLLILQTRRVLRMKAASINMTSGQQTTLAFLQPSRVIQVFFPVSAEWYPHHPLHTQKRKTLERAHSFQQHLPARPLRHSCLLGPWCPHHTCSFTNHFLILLINSVSYLMPLQRTPYLRFRILNDGIAISFRTRHSDSEVTRMSSSLFKPS